MADEKTEQPTPKRLRDSREKGDVPKSQELPSALIVACVAAFFLVASSDVFSLLSDLVEKTIEDTLKLPFEEAWPRLSAFTLLIMLKIAVPIVVIAMAAALLANLGQIGFLFAPKAAAPKLDNLNPQKWVKKVFSKKNMFDFAKNVAKVVVLSYAVKIALFNNIRQLFVLPYLDVDHVWVMMGEMLKELAFFAVGAFIVIALADFLYTRFKYTKEHMMSPDEVKREFKESEGDPMIKSKRKQLHQELLNQNTINQTKKAKVVVVNPTHYAVAIDYDKEKQPIPVILAKGKDEIAKRMIKAAQEENIPVMREAPLARTLYAQGNEGERIPEDLLIPVAKVLRYVETLKRI
ncbi:MAG TPA: EscU/YscU/HrcU family type III secretion system export apparatus switch protein [Succinivibrionaceae bacterium]|nr:EscU/YscU/HrcU family type III secretion system export apparatus switch protein [Succinivibrionaceae bacterium]